MRQLTQSECMFVSGGEDEPHQLPDVVVTGKRREQNAFEVTIHIPIFGGVGPTFGYAEGSNGGGHYFVGIGVGGPSGSVSNEDHDEGAEDNPNAESEGNVELGFPPSASVGAWTPTGQNTMDRINIYSDGGMPGYIPQPGDPNYRPY